MQTRVNNLRVLPEVKIYQPGDKILFQKLSSSLKSVAGYDERDLITA